MSNFRKLTRTIPAILLAFALALALVNATSCDIGGIGYEPETQGTEPGAPQGNNDNNEQGNQQGNYKNHYSEYANFNPADYPILNESGKLDSEVAELKDWFWLMYAENENVGEWTANYIKSNKIKTILSNESGAGGWIHPDQLDRLYLNEEMYSYFLEANNNKDEGFNYDDYTKARGRKNMFRTFTHETMHIVQYKSSGWIDLMKGMRPDICAAIYMLMEFLPWFYTTYRDDSAYVYADMKNAVETQSKYMIIETDMLKYQDPPKHYEDMRAKDPSLPPFIIGAGWSFSPYAQAAMSTGTVWGSAMTTPLIKTSKEDVLKIARALLACRDPKTAGVTDEALWTAFDFMRGSVETGEHLALVDGGSIFGCSQESFDQFQELIARWDTEFAKQ